MMQRILFFDIDGTLLNSEGVVPASAQEALKKLKENGQLLFVCTGRTKCMIPKQILDLPFDGIISGAGTYVEYGKEILEKYEMSAEEVVERVLKLRELKISYALEGIEHIYVEDGRFPDRKPYHSAFLETLRDVVQYIKQLEQVKVSKITCVLQESVEGEIKSTIKELEQYFNVIVHEMNGEKVLTDGLVELMPKGYSKATGIQAVVKKLGMQQVQTIGVGDSNNDLEMLGYVNTAVCMGNGTAMAKEKSDLITSDIDDNGIYNAMMQLKLI